MSKKVKGPDGTEYNSISEMCRHYSVRYNVYRSRKSRGYTQAQALGIERDFTIAHPVTGPDGVFYESVSEAARAFGKSPALIYERLARGWNIKEALATDPYAREKYESPDGKKFKSKGDIYRSLGLTRAAYSARIKHGWDKTEALSVSNLHGKHIHNCRHKKGKAITFKGQTYQSITEMCKRYGISINIYNARIRRGWSIEDALTIPVRHCRRSSGK